MWGSHHHVMPLLERGIAADVLLHDTMAIWAISSRIPSASSAVSSSNAGSYPLHTFQRRHLSYNPYESIMSKDGGGVGKFSKDGVSPSIAGKRMTAKQRKMEERIVLPTTLPSGRFEQKHTAAQTAFNREMFGKTEDPHAKPPDSRYYQGVSDFRQIKDADPYADLFGESKATSRVRVRFWQKQFEEENRDTWLPYERTNILLRSIPNWPIKYLVKLRDRGGYQTITPMVIWLVFVLSVASLYTYFFLARPGEVSDDIGDVR